MKNRFASFAELSMDNIVDTVMDDMDMEMAMHPEIALEDIYESPPNLINIDNNSAELEPSLKAYDKSNDSCSTIMQSASSDDTLSDVEEEGCDNENVNAAASTSKNTTKMVKVIPPKVLMTEIETYEPANPSKLQLKDHIFISKDCTYRLSQHLVREDWGNQCALLYKYLDYIFRCQVFNRDTVTISATNKHTGQKIKKHQYLLFHTGLQRRTDNQFLYALLVLNGKNKQQKYRVAYGNIKNSFMSHQDLIEKFAATKMDIPVHRLPEKTKFHQNISDLLYDDMCGFQVWY